MNTQRSGNNSASTALVQSPDRSGGSGVVSRVFTMNAARGAGNRASSRCHAAFRFSTSPGLASRSARYARPHSTSTAVSRRSSASAKISSG